MIPIEYLADLIIAYGGVAVLYFIVFGILRDAG